MILVLANKVEEKGLSNGNKCSVEDCQHEKVLGRRSLQKRYWRKGSRFDWRSTRSVPHFRAKGRIAMLVDSIVGLLRSGMRALTIFLFVRSGLEEIEFH